MSNYTKQNHPHRRASDKFTLPVPGKMIKVQDDVYEVQVTSKNRFSARNYDGNYITLTDVDVWEVL